MKINLYDRSLKRLIMMFVDVSIVFFSIILSFYLRYEKIFIPILEDGSINSFLIRYIFISPLIAILIFYLFGIYRVTTRYIDLSFSYKIFAAITTYIFFWFIIIQSFDFGTIPRSIYLIQWMLIIIFVFLSRLSAKLLINYFEDLNNQNKKNVILYGAGEAGLELSNSFKSSKSYEIIAFIDDNYKLHGQQVGGIKIFSFDSIDQLIRKYKVEKVIISTTSMSQKKLNEIVLNLSKFSLDVQKLPSISEITSGNVKINDIKDISIDDLLSRKSVIPNSQLLNINIENKVIFISGAGGSIGSELSRKIIQLNPKKIILFEQNELSLFSIDKEIKSYIDSKRKTDIEIISILGDIKNRDLLNFIFKTNSINTVYHAAAYKHVLISENNPTEFIQNNVFGTLTLANVSKDFNVETFIFISTDKAVRPSSIMGATKRVAELIIQSLNSLEHNTKFVIVRFGNVLGSSGSVIPIFKNQIANNGPVTVTDSNVIRYFMTIKEAAELVIQSGALANGGEVFVLDMGNPVSILDLAKKMIKLSGKSIKDDKNPNGDIEIKLIGLRPGEKLIEELLIGKNVTKTSHNMILKAEEEMIEYPKLTILIEELKKELKYLNKDGIIIMLKKIVSNYKINKL